MRHASSLRFALKFSVVRQRTPALLIVLCAAMLVSAAAGSLTPQSHPDRIPSLVASSDPGAMHGNQALDPHPFATEFYLQQFASENGSPMLRQQHSSWYSPVVSPVTNAASELSRKMASLRHALVRMIP